MRRLAGRLAALDAAGGGAALTALVTPAGCHLEQAWELRPGPGAPRANPNPARALSALGRARARALRAGQLPWALGLEVPLPGAVHARGALPSLKLGGPWGPAPDGLAQPGQEAPPEASTYTFPASDCLTGALPRALEWMRAHALRTGFAPAGVCVHLPPGRADTRAAGCADGCAMACWNEGSSRVMHLIQMTTGPECLTLCLLCL